jgi:hypothetical protein
MVCPLVLLVKVAWKEGRVLGSEKGKLMESGLIMQQRKESEIVG